MVSALTAGPCEPAFSTCLGGSGDDNGRAGCAARDGSLIAAGAAAGTNRPIASPCQHSREGPGDVLVAKLKSGVSGPDANRKKYLTVDECS